jgi:hypothetical protein
MSAEGCMMSELRRIPTGAVGSDQEAHGRRSEILARRLDDGYRRIDQAIATGADVSAWETFWIDLLHEYEAVCDELQDAA